MLNIIIVYNDIVQIKKFKDIFKGVLNCEFIDSRTSKGKRKAAKVKSHYAAKLEPFAVILDDNTPIRAFYSEAEDVNDSLIKYFTDYESENS